MRSFLIKTLLILFNPKIRFLIYALVFGYLLWLLHELKKPVGCVDPAGSSFCNACRWNVERILDQLEYYKSKHGHYPPAIAYDENGNPMHSWRALIFKYDELIGYRFSEPWNSPHNLKCRDWMPDCLRCPHTRYRIYCSSYMIVNTGANSNDNHVLPFIIETNNTSHSWLEPIDFPIANFDLDTRQKSTDDNQLRRRTTHYKESGRTRIKGTMTSLNGGICISEDTKPEALKALADPEKRDRVKITYPWGEDFGIVRAVLIDDK